MSIEHHSSETVITNLYYTDSRMIINVTVWWRFICLYCIYFGCEPGENIKSDNPKYYNYCIL